MDIVYLLLKIIAVCGMFTLMFLPLAKVTAWDDDAWSARYTVSALATTAWFALLVFVPGAIIACAVVWAVLLLLSVRHPSLRNLLPFWRWLLALRHRIKGDSPVFIVERVLGLRPIEDAPTDFKGVRDYVAAYSGYDETGEALLEFSCGISGVTDEFVEKKAKDGLGAMGAEVCKVEHLGPGHCWGSVLYTVELVDGTTVVPTMKPTTSETATSTTARRTFHCFSLMRKIRLHQPSHRRRPRNLASVRVIGNAPIEVYRHQYRPRHHRFLRHNINPA